MVWEEVTLATVTAHLPTDVTAQYTTWLAANPTKSGRLQELVDITIREFRDAIKSNHANIIHETETYLPQSCIRHCENIILFSLCMEMGLELSTAGSSARTAADIFLRQIPYGRWSTTTEDDDYRPSPSYTVPTRGDSSGRSLPIIAALLMFAQSCIGGWIDPGSTIYDTQIFPTYVATNYPITTATLYGHLAGIDARIGVMATGTPLYVESDPIWMAQKSSYATGTPIYAETDPAWAAASGSVLSASSWSAADSTTNYFKRYSVDSVPYYAYGNDWVFESGGNTTWWLKNSTKSSLVILENNEDGACAKFTDHPGGAISVWIRANAQYPLLVKRGIQVVNSDLGVTMTIDATNGLTVGTNTFMVDMEGNVTATNVNARFRNIIFNDGTTQTTAIVTLPDYAISVSNYTDYLMSKATYQIALTNQIWTQADVPAAPDSAGIEGQAARGENHMYFRGPTNWMRVAGENSW